jgi:hypothetical protein
MRHVFKRDDLSRIRGQGERLVVGMKDEARVIAGKESDLGFFTFDLVENSEKCGVAEAALSPGFHIVFKSGAEPFRSIVEGISEWLVYTVEGITAGHEHLEKRQMNEDAKLEKWKRLALSKAVEQARGCVATKIGLFDMIDCKSSWCKLLKKESYADWGEHGLTAGPKDLPMLF